MKKTIKIRVLAIVIVLVVSLTGCSTDGESKKLSKTVKLHNIVSSEAETEMAEKNISEMYTELETHDSIDGRPEEAMETFYFADESEELDEAQKNSIAMLNYLATLSQEINASKNSRMFLEEAYASLINNTNPDKVNELTESHLSSLLDIIEKYRLISVKRDRLQYIYDQNKAMAIKSAMPELNELLNKTKSLDIEGLARYVVSMAVDSYSSYTTYNNEIEKEFLESGWALDDEEAENLHDSRKYAFLFMIEIVREEKLPGNLALSENAVEDFVLWKNNSNNYQRLQFLESEQDTYYYFGNYWLELANCYYENQDYEKCLASVSKYEEVQADIFRKDYYLAQFIPKAIVAASEIYPTEKYISVSERYLEILLDNTEGDDWSLRYFAALVYLDMYVKTNNDAYLDAAYSVALNNVNYLVEEQKILNSSYLDDVQEVTIPDTATKEEKKRIRNYNKSLVKKRKTELPSVYEPLILNCELLFALAEKRNITDLEKAKIEGILHGCEDSVFLSEPIENRYTFANSAISIDAEFSKNKLILPAYCVTENSVIKVTVTEAGETSIYDDWIIKKVKRPTETFASFTATYTSKSAEKQKWSADSQVKVEIYDEKDSNYNPIVINFEVGKYKNYLIFKKVEFEQVK